MIQFGPVDLLVYRVANVLTSKILTVMFCVRKTDVEECLGPIQETDGVSCMSSHLFLSREPFHPSELKPVEVSYDISTFLGFCIFFFPPVICVWFAMKAEGDQEAAGEHKSSHEMTPVLGRSPESQMTVGFVMVESWSCWFFEGGKDSSDVFPQRRV